MLHGVGLNFKRYIGNGNEKFIVFNEIQKLEMLVASVHLRAGFRTHKRGKEVIAALNTALQQRL